MHLNCLTSNDSPQSNRLNHQVINDNTLACLRQVEVLGPKRSRVIQYLKYGTVSKGSYTLGVARSCASNLFLFLFYFIETNKYDKNYKSMITDPISKLSSLTGSILSLRSVTKSWNTLGFMFLQSCINMNQSPNHNFSITIATSFLLLDFDLAQKI